MLVKPLFKTSFLSVVFLYKVINSVNALGVSHDATDDSLEHFFIVFQRK